MGCVGDSPSLRDATDGGSEAPGTELDGALPVVGGGETITPDSGLPTGPVFAATVLDAIGIPAVGARVSVTGADGLTQLYDAGAGGMATGSLPVAPYDMTVQRAGSSYTHLFRGLSRLDPTVRLYGEVVSLPAPKSLALTLPTGATGLSAALAGMNPTSMVATAFTGTIAQVWSTATASVDVNLGLLYFDANGLAGSAFLTNQAFSVS